MMMTMRLVGWLDVILMNLMNFFFFFFGLGEEFGSGPTYLTLCMGRQLEIEEERYTTIPYNFIFARLFEDLA